MKVGNIETTDYVAKKIYNKLIDNRTAYLDRARDAASLTIPQLFPNDGDDGNTSYPTPYQSMGSRGVNNLANKIILSLFPPNSAFFKMGLNPADMQALGASQGEVEKSMYIIESSIIAEMEASSLRPKLIHLLKQDIVGGSAILYIPVHGTPEVHRMDTFGIKRDKRGNILKLVIKEEVNIQELDRSVSRTISGLTEKELSGDANIDLYTIVVNDGGRFVTWQTIKETHIKGSEGIWSKKEMPYIFVPFVDTGEDYGRSYIEDFYGDLSSYEGIRKSILQAAAESARIIYLVKPNATLSTKSLEKAQSGDVLTGSLDDVGTLQADKRLDLQVTQQEAEVLRMDLGSIFLLDSSVRRNAERVTAEEIRRVAQELEVALGGIYSTLANTLQEPLVRLYMNRLVKQGKLDDILKDSVEYEITTGSSALGRGTDFQTLTTFINTLGSILPPEVMGSSINMEEMIRRLAYSLDVNTAQLVKTAEEQQQEMEQQQKDQLEQQIAPEVAKKQMEQE